MNFEVNTVLLLLCALVLIGNWPKSNAIKNGLKKVLVWTKTLLLNKSDRQHGQNFQLKPRKIVKPFSLKNFTEIKICNHENNFRH